MAIAALLRGDWHSALRLHAFAPLFLVALSLIIGMAVLRPGDGALRVIRS
jgi:hypothetical protein